MALATLNEQQPLSRFSSLPPELRNAICDLYFDHDATDGAYTSAALLRTCRGIYNDTIQMFRAKPSIIRASALLPPGRNWPEIHISGDFRGRRACGEFTLYRFPRVLFYSKIISLVLVISTPSTAKPFKEYIALHHFLYGLVCHLTNHPDDHMKNLTVTIESKMRHRTWEKQLIYPLAKLDCRRWRVELRGSALEMHDQARLNILRARRIMPEILVSQDYLRSFISVRKRILELPQAYLEVVDQQYYSRFWNEVGWINPETEIWAVSILTSILLEAAQVTNGQMDFERSKRKWQKFHWRGWSAIRKKYGHLWHLLRSQVP